MIKKYSDDKETAPFGGELGTFYVGQLDKTLQGTISNMKEGEISFPKRINLGGDNYGYHIVYLAKRTSQHKANLNEDYNELEKLADQNKKQKDYEEWIKELKKKIYWDVRL